MKSKKASWTTNGQNSRKGSPYSLVLRGNDEIEGLNWLGGVDACISFMRTIPCISFMRTLVLRDYGQIEGPNWSGEPDASILFTRQILHIGHAEICAVMFEGFKGG